MNTKENTAPQGRLTEMQSKLLDMLLWFDSYCRERKIRYYIVEGTVIGAARHNGFIPWDDDIDIGIPRKDYDRLMREFKNGESQYRLETPYSENSDYLFPWCKLFDTTTTKIEKTRYNQKFGIYLDVFPLDGLGNTREESEKNYRKIDFLNMLWATRNCDYRKGRGVLKNVAIFFSRLIPSFLFDDKKLLRKIDQTCSRYDFDSCRYVSCTLSTYRSREIMKREVYGEPTEFDFEGHKIYGPEQYDAYLKTIYGNWRELPPEEEQVNRHDYLYLNLNESYI